MSARLLTAILAMTRGWLRLYHVRAAGRRGHRPAARSTQTFGRWSTTTISLARGEFSIVALQRLTAGMADDVGWRFEVAPPGEQVIARRAMALAAASVRSSCRSGRCRRCSSKGDASSWPAPEHRTLLPYGGAPTRRDPLRWRILRAPLTRDGRDWPCQALGQLAGGRGTGYRLSTSNGYRLSIA